MKIEGFLKDIGGASKVTKARRLLFKNASSEPVGDDPVRALSDALHPEKIRFIVREIRDSSPTSKTWKMVSADGHIPIFQSGQVIDESQPLIVYFFLIHPILPKEITYLLLYTEDVRYHLKYRTDAAYIFIFPAFSP